MNRFSVPEEIVINEMTSYENSDKTFMVELSDHDLKWISVLNGIKLVNPKTGVSKYFEHFKTDKDGSDEDVYGWWFKNEEGYRLLVIND